MGESVAHSRNAQAAIAETEDVRSPRDDRARGDGDQSARHATEITHAAEPVGQDDREADDADQRRLEHLQAGPHRNEGDRDAGERAEQRRPRRDPPDHRRDEPATISTKLCTNTQVRPASQAWTGSLVFIRIGSITTKVTTNMCGTLTPDGRAQTSVRPVFCARR